MDVILLEKIKNLGNLGDKVSVKGGYARNYLLPQQKAVPATTANLAEFEAKRAEYEQAQYDSLARAEDIAAKIEELTLVIAGKVGMEGKLYGSVSAADIANTTTEAGIEIKRHEVRLPNGAIRHVGDHEVTIHLHPDVNAILHVQVIEEA